MSITKGRITVKFLAPLRAPNAIMQKIEQELHQNRMEVGPFILASLMKNMGYGVTETRAAIKLAYPPRWNRKDEK